jgi:hypothetical protein
MRLLKTFVDARILLVLWEEAAEALGQSQRPSGVTIE